MSPPWGFQDMTRRRTDPLSFTSTLVKTKVRRVYVQLVLSYRTAGRPVLMESVLAASLKSC